MKRLAYACQMMLAVTALAEGFQPHEAIEAEALAFAKAHSQAYGTSVTLKAGALDPRLRLPLCREGLEAFYPAGSKTLGHVTVGVRCPGPNAWTVYVPVDITVLGKVLVAKRHLPRGSLLRMEDFRWEERPLTQMPSGYIDDPARLAGKRLKRPLPLGGVLLPSMIDTPPAVKRGNLVTILLETPLFRIQAQGKALGRGKAGDRIKVRNLSSRKVVEGTVIAPGLVKVAGIPSR